jgi:hypothetical protein
MQRTNHNLRAGVFGAASEQEASLARLTGALAELRQAVPAERSRAVAAREARDRVLQKLLKLLLLSRESEQLLLKNLSPSRRAAPAPPSNALLRGTYRSYSA